jgi:hypothetical protein
MEIGIRFGPVTNGLKNSPTGSKDRYNKVLATKLVIASTGAMLIGIAFCIFAPSLH